MKLKTQLEKSAFWKLVTFLLFAGIAVSAASGQPGWFFLGVGLIVFYVGLAWLFRNNR
jgi:1,4-dihydroxy-2-naphthoate octaprenyltransferase